MTTAVLAPASAARTHHLPAAVLVVVAAGLLAGLPELLGDLGRLAAVLVLQFALVLAWVLATGVQGFTGSLAVGAAAAVAADLAIVLAEKPALGVLLAVLGPAFLAVVVQQMVRRPRTELVANLSVQLLLCVVLAALAGWLLFGRAGPAAELRMLVAVLSVGAALLVGHLVDLVVPHPVLAEGVPRGLLALVAAVLAGVGVAVLGTELGGLPDLSGAVLLGGGLGLVAALTAVVASYLVLDVAGGGTVEGGLGDDEEGEDRMVGWVSPVLQVVLPVAVCAPAALALHFVL